MKDTLFDEFCDMHPEFQKELKNLDHPCRVSLERKLKKEKNETNFLSTVSEFRFAQFLQRENLNYDYEPIIISQKTPDFRINISDKVRFYLEIKRFNLPNKYEINNKFLYKLCKELERVEKRYYISITQLKLVENEDIIQVSQEIQQWLKENELSIGDTFPYKDYLIIEILKTDSRYNHILGLYHPLTGKKIIFFIFLQN